GSNMVIRGNNITGGRNGVVMKVWDSPESGSNHLIEKNYVHDLATSGDTRLGAFYLRDGQYFVIRNNVIYNCPNQKGGFFLYDSMDYGYPEEHHEIFNNIIDNAGYNGAVSMERQQNNTIKNNIIIDSLYAVGFEDWGGPYSTGHLFDYNCHYNNGVVSNDMSKFSDMIQDPNHNILLNPGVQASGSRPSPYYHLQDSSPCKNAGDLSTTEDQAGLVDYDGNARFVGQIDIGAFEYFYTSNTTPPNCFNPAPSGIIPSGTTSTNISLSTNMQAVCRYSNNSGTNYTSMEHNFTSTNSTNHSAQVSGLENGQTYVFYVRCNSSNGFVNDDDFNISFSVGGHKADINDDSVISMRELIAFIARWKANDGVSKAEVLAARDIWFTGGVY
ncbi:MAG: fibronectin type III domain-containing protein, partial [Candidatus Altiarchaeota archaeon]|nr:fibronectin type III domain-containing protein [Candidatus Altiarchaeota archaeon]